jgi:chromosome segregation ATPase
MTTDAIAQRIKGLSKSRDETLQVMRHLSLARQAAPGATNQLDASAETEELKEDLDKIGGQYEELQGRIENVQRQIDDSKKKITSLTEIIRSGLGPDQLESVSEEFHRVFGRLPVKKLDAARKTLVTQFKDQVIIAVGTKMKDTVFILVAVPRHKSSTTSQTLLLYDFTPIEIPVTEHKDPELAIQTEEERISSLSKELELLKLQLDELRKTSGQTLNARLDNNMDALMLLRGILKLGEGIQASQIYAHLEKAPPAETISGLTKRGIIELESSS